jgi:hypothetical protein
MKDLIKFNGFVILCLLSITLVSCDSTQNDQTTKEDVINEFQEAIDTAKAYTIDEKNQFMQTIKVKRDNTKVKINELKNKLISMKNAQKKALEEKLIELDNMQEVVEQKINSLSAASEEAYQDLRTGLDSAMVVLENSLKAANDEYK